MYGYTVIYLCCVKNLQAVWHIHLMIWLIRDAVEHFVSLAGVYVSASGEVHTTEMFILF